jgi:protein kinase C substrate 80K-H
MAVKAAVVGYEELTKPFDEVEGAEQQAEVEQEEEIEDKELDDLERKDLEGLLMSDVDGEDDEVDDESDVGLRKCDHLTRLLELMIAVYRIEEYIPDSLFEQYENLRDLALDWMIRIGLIGKGDKGHVKSTSDSPRMSFLTTLGWADMQTYRQHVIVTRL